MGCCNCTVAFKHNIISSSENHLRFRFPFQLSISDFHFPLAQTHASLSVWQGEAANVICELNFSLLVSPVTDIAFSFIWISWRERHKNGCNVASKWWQNSCHVASRWRPGSTKCHNFHGLASPFPRLLLLRGLSYREQRGMKFILEHPLQN